MHCMGNFIQISKGLGATNKNHKIVGVIYLKGDHNTSRLQPQTCINLVGMVLQFPN